MIIPAEAQRVFEGVLFDVYQWQQKLFDGSYATFERLRRPDSAFVIGVEDGQLVVLDQLQPDWPEPKTGFAAGRIDPGETALEAAQREMREEAGLEFANWRLLDVYQPESKIEWFIAIYLATGITSETTPKHEAGEQITKRTISFDDAKALATEGIWRMLPDFLRDVDSLDALLAWPEFEGREVELRDK